MSYLLLTCSCALIYPPLTCPRTDFDLVSESYSDVTDVRPLVNVSAASSGTPVGVTDWSEMTDGVSDGNGHPDVRAATSGTPGGVGVNNGHGTPVGEVAGNRLQANIQNKSSNK